MGAVATGTITARQAQFLKKQKPGESQKQNTPPGGIMPGAPRPENSGGKK